MAPDRAMGDAASPSPSVRSSNDASGRPVAARYASSMMDAGATARASVGSHAL